jgi:hypothetical protein
MKPVFALLAVLFLCGFMVESAQTRKERERNERKWEAEVRKRYDLDALRSFLAIVIDRQSPFEGVDLRKAKLGDKWIEQPFYKFSCGDWTFLPGNDHTSDEFTLRWCYDRHNDDLQVIVISCVREKNARFREVKISKVEEIILYE